MSLLAPDGYFDSVTSIDPKALVEQGFGIVILDIDNTLVPRGTKELPSGVRAWVHALREQGLRPCLLSNNWHRTVFRYADELDIPIVYKAMKPLPFAYVRALKKAARKKGEKVVVIGDQIFTDMFGAHILGYQALLVAPQTTIDLWYTLLLRKLEHLILGDRPPIVTAHPLTQHDKDQA
jgi:HAD superfamily phosphatase (TIGR01668 family)